MIRLLALLALFVTLNARAESQVLVPELPSTVDELQVMTIVQRALQGRSWIVTEIEPLSISATLSHQIYDAKLRIFKSGDALLYEQSAIATMTGGLNTGLKTKSDVPSRWIEFLKSDIETQLTAVSVRQMESEVTCSKMTAATRLRDLKSLLDEKLLTDVEYEIKRAEVIKDL